MLPAANSGAVGRSTGVPRAAAAPGSAPAAAPIIRLQNAAQHTDATRHREAHAAFTASLKKVVNAHRGTPVAHRESLVAQLALQSSSAARLQRQTHLTTLNMASVEEDTPAGTALDPAAAAAAAASSLPLSQLAFKALLRASLAAARLHHGYVTTPHLLLGLVSAGSASLAAAAPADSSSSDRLAAAAEAAVVALIDGPGSMGRGGTQAVVAGTGAAASLLGRSCGLDVVQWVPALSGPAREVLLAAEGLRRAQGHALVTSHHLLAVMLSNPPASSSSSGGSSSVVQQLLQELGFDTQAVSAGVAGRLTAAAADEDSVVCEPLGFLHEEFYGSLCAELLPGAVTSSSPCLN